MKVGQEIKQEMKQEVKEEEEEGGKASSITFRIYSILREVKGTETYFYSYS